MGNNKGKIRGAAICALAVLGLSASVQQSQAAIFMLVDDNSSAEFDTATPANNYNWHVDGVDQLHQQAFWFRVGGGPEQSLNTLPIVLQGTTDTTFDGNQDTLFVRYGGAGFLVEIRYTLDGGSPGSGAADMGEQISIIAAPGNEGPLDFHFFQYADFDLESAAGGDTVTFVNANSVQQDKGLIRLTETVVTPVPDHREADFFPVTLNKLNDGVATTLSDTPLGVTIGPGDVTWAYQWDRSIAPGQTFQISKDKNLSGAIPEPASASIVLMGAGLLLARRRKD